MQTTVADRKIVMRKILIILALACVSVLLVNVIQNQEIPYSLRSWTPLNFQQDLPYIETKGRQAIKPGCVNL